MDEADFGALVERIYDLGLDVESWPLLLEELAAALGARAGSLMRENMETHRGGGFSVGLDPTAARLYFEYYASRTIIRMIDNPRERMRDFMPTVTVDQDTIPKDDLLESEFYVDFLRPSEIHSVMTVGLWGRDVEFCGLDLYRPRTRPDFGEDERRLATALQPHLIRALRIGDKLEGLGDLTRGLAAGLDQAAFGCFVLDRDGRLRHANRAGERLLCSGGGLALTGGRLTASHPADGQRLLALIAAASGPAGARGGGSLAVRRGEGRAPLSVAVAPASPERVSPFSPVGGVVVCVIDPETAVALPEARLRQLFGLTQAQARVALALFEGQSLRDAAETLGLSIFTVRAHLAHIFDKTGVSRQGELVALLTRAAANGGSAS
jgi:DNA-binding CsgD family transcriptional regulator